MCSNVKHYCDNFQHILEMVPISTLFMTQLLYTEEQ